MKFFLIYKYVCIYGVIRKILTISRLNPAIPVMHHEKPTLSNNHPPTVGPMNSLLDKVNNMGSDRQNVNKPDTHPYTFQPIESQIQVS